MPAAPRPSHPLCENLLAARGERGRGWGRLIATVIVTWDARGCMISYMRLCDKGATTLE